MTNRERGRRTKGPIEVERVRQMGKIERNPNITLYEAPLTVRRGFMSVGVLRLVCPDI